MAVNVNELKNLIKAAFEAERNQTENPEACIDRIAGKIAAAVGDAIVEGINTATVTHVLANSGGTVTGSIKLKASAA